MRLNSIRIFSKKDKKKIAKRKTFLFGIKTETARARRYRALDGLRGNTLFQEQHNALIDTNCTKTFSLSRALFCVLIVQLLMKDRTEKRAICEVVKLFFREFLLSIFRESDFGQSG